MVKMADSHSKAEFVRQVLQSRIAARVYRAGEPLPSCRNLAAEFHVSYVTASLAVRAVVASGAARSFRGRGVFVTDITRECPVECKVHLIGPQADYSED